MTAQTRETERTESYHLFPSILIRLFYIVKRINYGDGIKVLNSGLHLLYSDPVFTNLITVILFTMTRPHTRRAGKSSELTGGVAATSEGNVAGADGFMPFSRRRVKSLQQQKLRYDV